MPKIEEKFEREARAARLIWARKDAGFTGPTAVAAATGIPINNVKAHEAGRNGFGMADARKYAAAFKVSLRWLYFGEGAHSDSGAAATVTDAPLVSWISAGELSDQIPITELGWQGTIAQPFRCRVFLVSFPLDPCGYI